MSSDTPRTDRAVAFDDDGEMVSASFARSLERELNKAMKELHECLVEKDKLFDEAVKIRNERDSAEQSAARLKYRLKRGEETAARMLEKTIQERDEALAKLRVGAYDKWQVEEKQ